MRSRGEDGSRSRNQDRRWKLDQLEWEYHSKRVKKLLIRDLVLKILKLKLIGSLQQKISAPIASSNQLETIRCLMALLQGVGFTAGAFDAQRLLECSVDQVLQASRSLYAKLLPLVGNQEVKNQVIEPIGQMIEPIGNISEADHTGSSQYASAGSEAESDMSMGIQRMSLGPAGARFLRKSLDQSEMEARSAQDPIVHGENLWDQASCSHTLKLL